MTRTLILALVALTTSATATEITFETLLNVSDDFTGFSNGLGADESLAINNDNRRVGPISLPRFDPSFGELNSVSLSVEFDGSEVDLPISFTNSSGGATTASIDDVLLRRGFVVAVNTGFIRPTVIGTGVQSLDLVDLTSEGFITSDDSSSLISIPEGVGDFPPDSTLELAPLLTEGTDVFSFTGTENFDLVVRTLNDLSVSFDQDDVNAEVIGGSIGLSGIVSVTYEFTPADELNQIDEIVPADDIGLDDDIALVDDIEEVAFENPLDDPNSIESRLAEIDALRALIRQFSEITELSLDNEAAESQYVLFRDTLSSGALNASLTQPIVRAAVVVPEPNALSMLLLALVGAAGSRRHR